MSGRLVRTACLFLGFAVVVVLLIARFGSAGQNPDTATRADGKRKPWTSSTVTGSPEPPPKFKSARVFPGVKFNHPLLIARCPGSPRLFIGEQEGVLYSIANGPGSGK